MGGALSAAEHNAAAGYITDVEYTCNFYPQQAPAWLAYVAAINGYAAPRIDRPFTWCELGCGKGVTALILAALHPRGEFHACDINAAHVSYGQRLRGEAGVGNLQLYLKDIAELRAAGVPQFDFITMHGLYSWVPEEVRAQIVGFLAAQLRPGGLAMVSYNAMPGWAHTQPLRQMMQAYAASLPGNSLEKARAAFGYVNFLAEQGAAYFQQLPAAAEHLRDVARRDIRYVAHEYMTPHGEPFYFAQVESRMRAAGLAFAGSMSPADNYPELMVAPRFHALLASAPTRTVLETHRDFITNTSFRADLYAKQPATAPAALLPLERFDGLAFCLANLPERLLMKQEDGTLRFDLEPHRDAVQAVHALLAKGPADARAIHRAGSLRSEVHTTDLIQQLVVARHLTPSPAEHPGAGWLPVNSAMVEAGIREQAAQISLACPLAGTASQSEVVHAAAVEAAARYDDAERATHSVLQRLRALGHPVERHGRDGSRVPAKDDEVLAYLDATWRSVRDPASPDGRLLRLFGVLA